jgi:hypothetical protein
MDTVLWIVAGAAVLLGIAGIVLPLLPGTPLLFGGLWLAAWLDGYTRVSVTVVVVLGVLGVLAWAVDYLAATLGVKRVGASGKAVAGAAIGTVLGLFAGLPGLILGRSSAHGRRVAGSPQRRAGGPGRPGRRHRLHRGRGRQAGDRHCDARGVCLRLVRLSCAAAVARSMTGDDGNGRNAGDPVTLGLSPEAHKAGIV